MADSEVVVATVVVVGGGGQSAVPATLELSFLNVEYLEKMMHSLFFCL